MAVRVDNTALGDRRLSTRQRSLVDVWRRITVSPITGNRDGLFPFAYLLIQIGFRICSQERIDRFNESRVV